ncbi:uncharacterized conserved protein [Moorella thermoacetica Y72]|uniref:Uncharacterized conserved protein n=1 Tax=Moorella thermoacetica Y72 TaxID=1325331 RepID=A0A0S6UBJ1_NEOTH|nr:uncharacterized conserved protein [Moorella thermoacetica Y72]
MPGQDYFLQVLRLFQVGYGTCRQDLLSPAGIATQLQVAGENLDFYIIIATTATYVPALGELKNEGQELVHGIGFLEITAEAKVLGHFRQGTVMMLDRLLYLVPGPDKPDLQVGFIAGKGQKLLGPEFPAVLMDDMDIIAHAAVILQPEVSTFPGTHGHENHAAATFHLPCVITGEIKKGETVELQPPAGWAAQGYNGRGGDKHHFVLLTPPYSPL